MLPLLYLQSNILIYFIFNVIITLARFTPSPLVVLRPEKLSSLQMKKRSIVQWPAKLDLLPLTYMLLAAIFGYENIGL